MPSSRSRQASMTRRPNSSRFSVTRSNMSEKQQQKLVDAVDQALADELAEASARDRRRMRTAADAWLGKRPIYTNHCEGLHYPFLPADEFFDREHFPWLGELEAATSTIVAELESDSCRPTAGTYALYFAAARSAGEQMVRTRQVTELGRLPPVEGGRALRRRLCSGAAHRRLGGIASDLPHRGQGAQRLFLDPEGGQPYPGAYRGDQRAKRRPLAADRSGGVRVPRRR